MPLIYTSNQELIDHHIKNAQDIINAQTVQIKQVAGTHAGRATEITKQFMGDYTSKAQEMLRGRQASASTPASAQPASSVQESDFPAAPKEDISVPQPPVAAAEPAPAVKEEEEPLIAA